MRRLLCDMLDPSVHEIGIVVPSLDPKWDYSGTITISDDERRRIKGLLGPCDPGPSTE